MSYSEALSKLHEILRVLIGDSAEEWRLQKQQTGFTSDWEWADHLLAVHRSHCNSNDCTVVQCMTGSCDVSDAKSSRSPSNVLPSQTMFKATRPFKSARRHGKHHPPHRSASRLSDPGDSRNAVYSPAATAAYSYDDVPEMDETSPEVEGVLDASLSTETCASSVKREARMFATKHESTDARNCAKSSTYGEQDESYAPDAGDAGYLDAPAPSQQPDFSSMVDDANSGGDSWRFSGVSQVASDGSHVAGAAHDHHTPDVEQVDEYYDDGSDLSVRDVKPDPDHSADPQCAAKCSTNQAVVGSRPGLMTNDTPEKALPHSQGHDVPLRHQAYDERLLLAASEQARAELMSVAHVSGNLSNLDQPTRFPIDLTDHRLPVFPSTHHPVSPDNSIRLPQSGHQYQRPENYTVEELDRMVSCRAYDMTKEPGERPSLHATENTRLVTTENTRIPNISPFSPPMRQVNEIQRPNMSPMSQGRLMSGMLPNFHGMQAYSQPIRRSSLPFSDYDRATIVQQAMASIMVPSDNQRLPISQPFFPTRRLSTSTSLDSDRLPNFSSLQLPRRNTIDSADSERSGSDSGDAAMRNDSVHSLDDVKPEPHAKRPRGRPKRSSEGSDDATNCDPVYHRFTCTVCSKGFPFKHSLTAHLRVHTGERPFSCDVCASTFTQLGSLNTHKKLHNQPVYKCSMCNWSTRKQELLEKHIKLHYNDNNLVGLHNIPPMPPDQHQ